MPDRPTPFDLIDEKGTLVKFLDYLRESVVVKLDDLDADAVRRSPVPSGTSLLGLVVHLTRVEVVWFPFVFAGLDVAVPTDDVGPDLTVVDAVTAYRSAIDESNRIIAACDDLETRCTRAAISPEPLSMRWLLVHMVEETARHAGHADILREQIDGRIGR